MRSGATSSAKGSWLASMYDTLAVIIASDLQLEHAQLHLLAGFVS